MSEQEYASRHDQDDHDEDVEAPTSRGETSDQAADDQGYDALLDEIDEVLETNAEEFVRSYVQKGGQ